ncbi:dolichol-phosphate mannosyltransferase subunit 3-like [Xenia sp. Carnegie-2017]|uniref:dolichol-phosphate mannosyltransferase subunit 3-like n=1 Tax=Xenia sp. Carnegie-2017 TaxID=2897299 RepID=UPI001F045DB6|nr:dolichol-phosphate mannosyltransferase subunit 3-like [Xenia sp. Carnegie-2017]
MTKLMQWLCFFGLVFTIWMTLLADILPLSISKDLKDVVLPFPIYMVLVFGCYSLMVIGYRVLTFNDCEDAAESLKKEIQEARKDLTMKGFRFD